MAFYKPLTMNGKQLKNSILQWAIQGKLVPQDPSEGTADELLQQIRAEKEKLVTEKKLKKSALDNESVISKSTDGRWIEKIGKKEIDITDEIPFEIPEGWRWCRVSSLFQINPGVQADNNLPSGFVPMEAIDAGYGSSFRYYEKKWGEIKGSYTQFADGDIAFAKITPCFQNRKSVVFKGLPNGIGAGTSELKVLRTFGENIDRYYTLYFLESPYFVDEATFKGTANQQRIIIGYLEDKLFPLPPLSEQHRIVSQLERMFKVLGEE